MAGRWRRWRTWIRESPGHDFCGVAHGGPADRGRDRDRGFRQVQRIRISGPRAQQAPLLARSTQPGPLPAAALPFRVREQLPPQVLARQPEVCAQTGAPRPPGHSPGQAARPLRRQTPRFPRRNRTRRGTCRARGRDSQKPIACPAARGSRDPCECCPQVNIRWISGNRSPPVGRLRGSPLWSRADPPKSPVPWSLASPCCNGGSGAGGRAARERGDQAG